jgi:hypothetical protein
MEIALLKSKNQFVLKTNPPTHTPFFLFLTDAKKKPTHNRKATTTTTIASKLALVFQKQNKQTNRQTNKLTLFKLSANSKVFCPSMLSYPQLKSPINLFPIKTPPQKKTSSSGTPPESPHTNQDWIPDCVFFFFKSNLFEETK